MKIRWENAGWFYSLRIDDKPCGVFMEKCTSGYLCNIQGENRMYTLAEGKELIAHPEIFAMELTL